MMLPAALAALGREAPVLDSSALTAALRACADDTRRLVLLAEQIDLVERHAAVLREQRARAAARLDALGVPRTLIGKHARVTDSYIGREITRAAALPEETAL